VAALGGSTTSVRVVVCMHVSSNLLSSIDPPIIDQDFFCLTTNDDYATTLDELNLISVPSFSYRTVGRLERENSANKGVSLGNTQRWLQRQKHQARRKAKR
jgi:hypothetical protein